MEGSGEIDGEGSGDTDGEGVSVGAGSARTAVCCVATKVYDSNIDIRILAWIFCIGVQHVACFIGQVLFRESGYPSQHPQEF